MKVRPKSLIKTKDMKSIEASEYGYKLESFKNAGATQNIAKGFIGYPPSHPNGIILRYGAKDLDIQNFGEMHEQFLQEFKVNGFSVEPTVKGYKNGDGFYTAFSAIYSVKTIEVGGEKFKMGGTLSNSYDGTGAIHIGGFSRQGEQIFQYVTRQVCTNGLTIKVPVMVQDYKRKKDIQMKIRNTTGGRSKFDEALEQIEFMLANEANLIKHIERLQNTEVALTKEQSIALLLNSAKITVFDNRKKGVSDNFVSALGVYEKEQKALAGYEHGRNESSLWLAANAVNNLYSSDTPQLSFKYSEAFKKDENLWSFANTLIDVEPSKITPLRTLADNILMGTN